MMTDINKISKEIDLSNAYKMDWDTQIHGEAFDVYRIPEHVHTIGGRYGENCLWCCKRGETPTWDNLIEFNGESVCWGIQAEPHNYIRSKWGESSVESNMRVAITRNGEDFYTFFASDIAYGLARAVSLLSKIRSSAVEYDAVDYPKQIEGRKVYYKGVPAVLEHWMPGQGCVMVKAADGHIFPPDAPGGCDEEPGYYEKSDKYEQKINIIEGVTNIRWFREESPA